MEKAAKEYHGYNLKVGIIKINTLLYSNYLKPQDNFSSLFRIEKWSFALPWMAIMILTDHVPVHVIVAGPDLDPVDQNRGLVEIKIDLDLVDHVVHDLDHVDRGLDLVGRDLVLDGRGPVLDVLELGHVIVADLDPVLIDPDPNQSDRAQRSLQALHHPKGYPKLFP